MLRFRSRIRAGGPDVRGGGLSPASLFNVAGSRGFFYDFSDYNTLFQDTAGTTPVTGVGQSVGLVLDESQGLALGPELVTNGDFSAGATGWTVNAGWSITGGTAVAAATTASLLGGGFTPVAGRTYRVDFDVVSYTSGTLFITVGGNFSGNPTLSLAAMAPGRKTVYVTAGATPARSVEFYGGSIAATIDNISVRELPGNHATQATAGSRALTQVRPMFTQRNFAGGSELPENSAIWLSTGATNGITVTKSAWGIDTDGLPYADYTVSGTATAADRRFIYAMPTALRPPSAAGQQWSVSAIIRRTTGSAPPAGCGASIDVLGEAAPGTYVEGGGNLASPVAPATDTTITRTFTLANVSTNQANAPVTIETANGATVNYTIRIKGLMLERGAVRTAYQVAVSGELRNLMPTSGNPVLWSSGGGTVNGITVTRVATGFDAAGLPYADYSVSGTATAADFRGIVGLTSSVRPAVVGQTFTSSFYVARIAGSAPPANSGVYSEVAELGAGGTFLAGTASLPQDAPTPEAIRTITRTLSNASLVDVRGGVIITTASGATVNYTVRIKAPQFEQNATYSRYQRTITANEWYEPGFTSFRGIRFDGSDDFLQTAAIDFAGAESLGAETLTNGDFSAGATGWTSTAWVISGGAATLTNASDSLTQNVSFVAGRTYRVQFTLSGFSGTGAFRPRFFGGTTVTGTNRSADGTYSEYIVAVAGNNQFAMTPSTATCTGTIDNISVREVLIPADKMTVVAGVRKLSDAATAILVELSTNLNTNDGAFFMAAPITNGGDNYAFASKGTAQTSQSATGFAAPSTAVVTGLGNISGGSVSVKVNTGSPITLSASQGTGTYGNHPVYIGRRGGTTLPFNGVLTFLCVINRTLTADDLARLETFANSRTGAY